jgi:adenosylcobinamide-phosphate synthase
MIISRAVLIYLIGTTIALRELASSAGKVIAAVKAGVLDDAKTRLGMIVGRDTADLTDEDVLRATIETLAENLSDGVIAPVFYLAIGGLPLAIAYKAINTLDSMVGYKNKKYINFGWASARMDDIANYIPARITGMLIVLAVFLTAVFRKGESPLSAAGRSFMIMRRDGRNHTSPNSGIPEAAMAGGLDIRMGGPSTYGGILVEKPYIGEAGDADYLSASEHAIRIVQAASVICVWLSAYGLYLRGA